MQEEIREQTSKEFMVQEWKHWSTKQSEFVRLPESCKSEITKWWLDKLDTALQAQREKIARMTAKDWLREQIKNGIIKQWSIAGKDGYFIQFNNK